MSAADSNSPPTWQPFDPDGRVAIDLPCLHCGYNLRTRQGAESCPECNTAVRRSLAGVRLRHGDRAYFRSLVHGVQFLAFGWGLPVAASVCMVPAMLRSRVVGPAIAAIGLSLFLAGLITALLGCVFVGRARALDHRRQRRLKKQLRSSLWLALAAAICITPTASVAYTLGPFAILLPVISGSLMLIGFGFCAANVMPLVRTYLREADRAAATEYDANSTTEQVAALLIGLMPFSIVLFPTLIVSIPALLIVSVGMTAWCIEARRVLLNPPTREPGA